MLELHTNHNQPFSLIVCFDSQEIDIASTFETIGCIPDYSVKIQNNKILEYRCTSTIERTNVRKNIDACFFWRAQHGNNSYLASRARERASESERERDQTSLSDGRTTSVAVIAE